VSPIVGNASLIGLIKDGPNPNAGKLLIEFVLSDEGQEVLRNANYVPASQAVQPVDPNMRPGPDSDTKVMMMTPDLIENNVDKWIAVMNEKFR
jgi:ABC-type Fe3+ transport system substrate-binding protein